MYDDDIAPRAHLHIRAEDRPPTIGVLPPAQDQELILGATQAGQGGWGPERVSAHLRRAHGRDISPDTVRLVLAHART